MMQRFINSVSKSYLTNTNPRHLIVIKHGWLAHGIRATPLAKGLYNFALKKANNNSKNGYMIHIIGSNCDDYVMGWKKTNDGIHHGGKRAANEIKSILDKYESINKISLIGQSLGGLYIRFAIKELYNFDNDAFYRNVKPCNFVTMGSPHLGTEDWVKIAMNGYLYKFAKYAKQFGIVPSTIEQLINIDNDRLLYDMASNKQFLLPLTKFKNRLIYANSINDNRVSASSGLLLPSYDNYLNEKKYIDDIFDKYKENNKASIVKSIKPDFNDMDETNKWYHDLAFDSIEWKRFIVQFSNSNFLDKSMAHGLLSNPVPSYTGCQPILEHLTREFEW